MKLKTLKDFLPLNGTGDGDVSKEPLLTHYELQQVASEYLKKLANGEGFSIGTPENGYVFRPGYTKEKHEIRTAVIIFLKHFFNLEDPKWMKE